MQHKFTPNCPPIRLSTFACSWEGARYLIYNSTDADLSTFGEGQLLGNGTTHNGPAFAYGTLGDGSAQTAWLCLPDGCFELDVGGGKGG